MTWQARSVAKDELQLLLPQDILSKQVLEYGFGLNVWNAISL